METTVQISAGKRIVCLGASAMLAAATCLAPVALQPQTAWGASTNKQLSSQASSFNKKAKAKTGSKKARLKKAAAYAEKTFGYSSLSAVRSLDAKARAGSKGWWKKSALYMFKNKKGSCYLDAAAFAVAAKKATGYTVRIAAGKARSIYWNPSSTSSTLKNQVQYHAWAEVKIGKTWYVYDTNLDRKASDARGNGKYIGKKRSTLKKVYNNFKEVKYQTVKF